VGYNVYLVTRGGWWDAAARFGPEEWGRLQVERPLPDWIAFEDGAITVKSPTREQVVAFAALARDHGWSVQGDDGEIYGPDGVPVVAPAAKLAFFAAALKTLRDLMAGRSIRRSMRGVVCPFQVGDRVRNTFKTGGVVIAVDAKGNHGLGSIKVRFPDGVVLGTFFVDHDWRKEA
jgi:hypothetical protein